MVKQQFYSSSCGAACLLVAAGELGIGTLPNMPGTLCQGQVLQMDNACESAIYQISSGSTTGVKPVQGNLSKAGYSLPHNVVFAARLLHPGRQPGRSGFSNVAVFMAPGVFSTVLSSLYPQVRALCEGMDVTIHDTAAPGLAANQREMRIVGVLKGVAGLHYVLNRPDGTCMDPASGADYPSFDAANDSFLKCYQDTGISIVLG